MLLNLLNFGSSIHTNKHLYPQYILTIKRPSITRSFFVMGNFQVRDACDASLRLFPVVSLYYYPIKLFAFAKAASKPLASLPPAVAKKG